MSGLDVKPHEAAFGQPGHAQGGMRRIDGNAQFFGHNPAYMMQGQPGSRGFHSDHNTQPMPMPGSNLQFDELLAQEEWANSFIDPALGMANGRQPVHGHAHFAGQGPGMGGWR